MQVFDSKANVEHFAQSIPLETVANIDRLRTDIDAIVAEIEGKQA